MQIIDYMSIREEENQDLVELYVGGSQEEQGQYEEVSDFLPQKISIADFTSTSNFDPVSMDHTYDEEQVVNITN